MRNKVNQQMIADDLNLSRITVTKSLNRDYDYRISPETRRLVLETARRLGYKMPRRRNNAVALVICGELTVNEKMIYTTVCEEAWSGEFRVFLLNTRANPGYRELVKHINRLSVDGVIISGYIEAAVVEQIRAMIPVVIAGQHPEVTSVDRVYVDSFMAGRVLTEYLLGMGHTRIAAILHSLDIDMLLSFRNGFQEAMTAAGLRYAPSMIWEKERAYYPDMLRSMMSKEDRPTSIIACTPDDHPIIMGILDALGYKIPTDISYVGFGNLGLSSMKNYPKLTYMADDGLYSVAKAAFSRLYSRIEGEEAEPQSILMQATDIVRGSTCIPYNSQREDLL